MEVAATVNITFNSTENQGGGVRCPAKGTFTLKPRAATTLALAALVVAPVERAHIRVGSRCPFSNFRKIILMTKW